MSTLPSAAAGPASSQDSPRPLFKLREDVAVTVGQDSDTFDVSQDRDLVPDAPVSAVQRPRWSVKQAAKECGVSDRTITRRLSDLQERGASRDADGHRLIPVGALQAVGFQPGKPAPAEDVSHRQSDSVESVSVGHDAPRMGTVVLPVENLIDLREQVATLKGERDAALGVVHGLEVALSATQTAPPGAGLQPVETGEPVERRWWGGKKKRH